MKKIVISGITGFLGSHLAKGLLQKGYKVIGIKRSTSSLDKLSTVLNELVLLDVDSDDFNKKFLEMSPEIVIHTACSYGRSGESIENLVNSNVIFPLHLLELSVKAEVKCFINTDSALEKQVSPYALSKYQFKEWGKFLGNKIKFINVRIEHMYGADDDNYKFIKWFVDQLHSKQDEIRLTSGIQKRDFIYIDDVVSAYDVIVSKIGTLEGFCEIDVTTDQFVQVKDFLHNIVQQYEKSYGISETILKFGVIPYREHEAMVPNVSGVCLKEMGWFPKVSHAEGIKRILKELK